MVMANLLSRSGEYHISVFEKRTETQLLQVADDKSINLTISNRGLRTLSVLGLADQVIKNSAPVVGRTVHKSSGKSIDQSYGNYKKKPKLYSIRRHELIEVLYDSVRNLNGVDIKLGEEFTKLDKRNNEFYCGNKDTNVENSYPLNFLLGCDGTFSRVRSEMIKGEPVNFQQRHFQWSYVRFSLSSNLSGLHNVLNPEYIHFWPREDSLALLLPNSDGSFSGDLFLERNGPLRFEDFQNSEILDPFLQRQFPDLERYLDILSEQIRTSPEAFTVCNQLSDWTYDDKVLLVGDSSHACYYFYGQGLNISLEDSLYLCQNMANKTLPDLKSILQNFQKIRKVNSDILLELSESNFFFLKDKSAKLSFMALDLCNHLLNRITPKWKLEYELITDGDCTIPEAMKRIRVQRIIFRVTCSWLFALSYVYLALFPNSQRRTTKKHYRTLNGSNHV